MLIRIFLIVAIIGALAVVGLDVTMVKDKITATQNKRDEYKKNWTDETEQHRKFKKLAEDTKTKLDATNAMLVATMTERDTAVAKATELTATNAALAETLKKTAGDLDMAQNKLAAWDSLGVPIDRMKATLASLKTVTDERDAIAEEKKILQVSLHKADEKIKFLTVEDYSVKMPDGLKGKVLVTDPRYDFVVLDIGEKQGVLENGRLIVNRNGKLIAKVEIKSVQADRSIANVMPGWKLSDVMEGDQVLY